MPHPQVRSAVALVAAALATGVVARALAAPQAPREQAPDPARAINWSRALTLNARYRTVVDTSGLVEIAGSSRMVDPTDLGALCTAKQEVVGIARRKTEAELRELGAWSDPITDEKRSALLRLLGVAASFEG